MPRPTSPVEPTASNEGRSARVGVATGQGPAPRAPQESPLLYRRQRQGHLVDRLPHLGQLPGQQLRELAFAAAVGLRRLSWPSCSGTTTISSACGPGRTRFNPNVKQGTVYYDDPMPYERPGPELALDGKPKFDLDRFNQAYFDRMRAFVTAARDKGIYASVMLFNGFSIEGKGNVGGDAWQGHYFNPQEQHQRNRRRRTAKVHTLADPAVTALQEAYVRKIIDTVNDLDNVLYEIANEDTGGPANTEWQYHMIRFIKDYEATKPKQHPVGMTVQYPQRQAMPVLQNSPADWISPAAKVPKADGGKVVINDTDHSYFWIGLKADGVAAQRAWVWKNFTRGYQCMFMDPYLDPGKDAGRNNPSGRHARSLLGPAPRRYGANAAARPRG